REHQPAWMIAKHLLASYVSGWFLLGGAIAIGASGLIRPRQLIRSVARIGFSAVALAVVIYPLALHDRDSFMIVRTPLGQLLPEGLPSTSFFFSMLLFTWEDLLGIGLPRLSLFSPWTTAMGFIGLCLIFISLNETEPRRRRLAIGAGAFMVIASVGR